MLTKEDFAVIKSLSKRGVYKKDIAEELGVHPKTVSRALKRNQAPEKKRAKRGSKLDPFKKDIDQLLAKNVWNAKVILREIEAEGYTGGYTILRGYIQPKRVLRQGKATVRFETKPGKQLQHDWANIMTMIAGQELKVHFQVNTLGYSRRFHVWCCLREDAEPQMRCWWITRKRQFSNPAVRNANRNSTRAFWTWLPITASQPRPAGHTGHAPKARRSAWSIMSKATSLYVTGNLRVGHI